MRLRLLLLGVLAACKNDGGGAVSEQPKPAETGRKLAGVYPDKFQCESIVSLDALSQVLGGKPRAIDAQFAPPRGVPAPCNYEITGPQSIELWMYDIDCRDGMKKRADALFAQYATDSADQVQRYNVLSDAGKIEKTDAGIDIHAPEGAAEVQVGLKALDHHGQGLIFIDDDAPCYVRVVGPSADKRLELAKLVAKNLTFQNAPMTPRPMP